ncbi:MAG: putative DNA binding domain-containing protein [Acidobacteria bacterium]|nr:putative DNA binding domain-containing protein [Acidobacteriota bacterium]
MCQVFFLCSNPLWTDLEFKEAKTQYDFTKTCEYCVALANEGGGYLLFGICDKPPRSVVGTAAVNNPRGMAEKLFQTLGFRIDVEEVNHTDGRVIVFHIPSRPRGTAYHLKGTYLMRSGEQLVPMSEDQLRRIFAEGEPDWLEEYSQQELDAQTVVELLDTQTFFELINLPYPLTQQGVLDRLEQERLIDNLGGTYAIRRLGAILLARRLENFPDLIRKAPRVIVYIGTSKLETKLDQVGSKGYAVGFQGLVRFVVTQLPQNEVIEDALRKETKLVPEIAIRELIANALIHQDFRLTGTSVMIEIYSDRVEISNPGDPIVPLERFIDGYQSRNERLADLMRRFSICEEKGSGIDRVIQTAEVYQLPAPDFRSGYHRTSVVLFAPTSFENMDRNDRVRACYQHCCLRYVMHQRMTNQSLRTRFKLVESKSALVSQTIAAALDAGSIKVADPTQTSQKYRSYIPFWA